MKPEITYKKITLVAGILVAVLVVITLWGNNRNKEKQTITQSQSTKVSKISSLISSEQFLKLLLAPSFKP